MQRATAPRLAAILAGIAVGSGCASVGTFETAHGIGAGRSQLSVEPALSGVLVDSKPSAEPSLAVSYRHGLSDSAELGFRLGTTGADLLTKFVVAGGRGRLTLALAPSVGAAFFGEGSTYLSAQLPLLVGVPIGWNELVLSPKVHYEMHFGSTDALSIGAGVGYSVRAGPGLQVLPEVTVLHPLGSGSAVLFLAGVGILLGGE